MAKAKSNSMPMKGKMPMGKKEMPKKGGGMPMSKKDCPKMTSKGGKKC